MIKAGVRELWCFEHGEDDASEAVVRIYKAMIHTLDSQIEIIFFKGTPMPTGIFKCLLNP